MKHMKKVVSVLLSTLLVMVSVCLPLTITASAWEARINDVDLRLGFLNDTHVNKNGSGEEKTIAALSTLKTLGMEKLAFVGDNVYYPAKSDDPSTDRGGYERLSAGLTTAGWSWDDVLVYAMGNHEFPQGNYEDDVIASSIAAWQEETGFETKQHEIHNGFHFISVAPDNGGNVYASSESYMKAEIEAAIAADSTNDVDGVFADGVVPNSTKPVFLLLHGPMSKTIIDYSSNAVSADFVKYLSTRPQVINVTAHMHLLAQHPEVICQDAGFTVFQSSTTAGGYHSQWDCTEEGNITDSMCSQGSFMEIKDNVVSFYRLDYLNGSYIGEPFVVDIPNIVADRISEDTTDDYNHMPYRTEVRNAIISGVAFPEDAEVTVETQGSAARITFPNTAYVTSYDETQQDNFVRAYQVDVEAPNGAVVSSNLYQADFWKASANRAETYTKNVGGLSYGTTYTAKVYPVTPFKTLGEPILAEFTTEDIVSDDDAIRVEFEDYSPAEQVRETEYASANGIMIAAQTRGWLNAMNEIARPEGDSDYTFQAEVTAPFAGEYKVQYAVGYLKSVNSVSALEISIGDTKIGDNSTSTRIGDLSVDGTYPWSHIPLTLFQGNNVTLAAGKNTIDVAVKVPTNTKQPILFCMDYIEFTPVATVVDLSATERIEFEDFESAVAPIVCTNGKSYVPDVLNGAKSSGGKFLHFDSYAAEEGTTMQIPVPIYVSETGVYNMEYIATSYQNVDIYLDNTDGTALDDSATRTQLETEKQTDADGVARYQIFSAGYAGYSFKFSTILPQGAHTLIFVLRIRNKTNADIMQALDYVDIIPATDRLTKGNMLLYEAEDYTAKFKSSSATLVKDVAEASGGKAICRGSGTKAISASFPFFVAEAGTYVVEYVGHTGLSTVSVTMDGTALTTSAVTGVLYKHNTHYEMKKYRAAVELTVGFHELVYNIALRSDNTLGYSVDYISVMPPIAGTVSSDDVMRMEFESLVGSLPSVTHIAGEKTETFTPSAGNGEYCSGGKYLFIDSENSEDTYYTFSVNYHVKDAGYYHLKCVDTQGVSTFDIFLDSTDGTNIVTGTTITTPAKYHVNVGTAGTGETTSKNWYRYFSSSWAKVRMREGQIYLDEGIQTVVFRVKNRGTNKDFAQYLDYFQLAPVESFTVADGTATAKAVYDTAVTGKVILALYNDKELVSMNTVDASAKKVVTVSTPASVAFTSAKVFAWGDLTNIVPLTSDKEFTVE